MKVNNKKNVKKSIIYITFLIVTIYLIYAVYLLIKQPTNKFTVEEGTLYLEETDIGYIIRDEQVVKGNNYKNGMEQIKTEGEKTSKGESIYRYYSKNENELIDKIAELDVKIQEALGGQSDLYLPDVKLIENQIDEKVQILSNITDVSKMTEYKKEINNLVTKKAKMVGSQSAAGSFLEKLYTQRTNLETQLNSGAEYITAPVSGIVSYKVDGLEETLSPNNFSTLSKDFLESLKLKTGQIIATNNECGKIINNFKCYIATISKSEEAKQAKIGGKVQVRLSNNEIINANIVYLSQENEDETLLVLEIDRRIDELTNYRKISFGLIWWSSTGLKVPNQAIVEIDGLNYVVRNRAGYLSKILIKVGKQNEKYSVVSNYKTSELEELGFTKTQINSMRKLSLYDELVLNPDLSKVE